MNFSESECLLLYFFIFFFKLSCRLNNTVRIAKHGKGRWTGNVPRMCEKGMRTGFYGETSLITSKLRIVRIPKKKRIFMENFLRSYTVLYIEALVLLLDHNN
jgi:hypothetical protein